MHLSPWGRVVAISALLVVGGAIALAVGALASTRERLVSYPVTGTLDGLSFDLDDGDIVIVGGGRANAVEVRRTERSSFGHEPVTQRVGRRQRRARSLALPHRAARAVHGRLPGDRARQRRARRPHERREREPARLSRLGPDHRPAAARSTSRTTAATRSTRARAPAPSRCRPPARRRGCRCARARARSARRCRPAATTIDAESSSGRESVRGLTARDDAPYSVQALSGSGDVTLEGRS